MQSDGKLGDQQLGNIILEAARWASGSQHTTLQVRGSGDGKKMMKRRGKINATEPGYRCAKK
jgi:hypothetical protein